MQTQTSQFLIVHQASQYPRSTAPNLCLTLPSPLPSPPLPLSLTPCLTPRLQVEDVGAVLLLQNELYSLAWMWYAAYTGRRLVL